MTLLGHWPRPKHSSDHATTESALRCCLHISSASCARPPAIARAARCPVRVHAGGDRPEPAQVGQARRPAATAGRPMCGVSIRSRCSHVEASAQSLRSHRFQRSQWQLKPPARRRGATYLSHRRLPQQNLPIADSCTAANSISIRSPPRRAPVLFRKW